MSVGYLAPTYDTIRASIVSRWKSSFGANADTSSDTVGGLILDVFALFLQKNYEALSEVTSGAYLTTATGLQIDYLLGSLFNSHRLPARATAGPVLLYGTAATLVPAGSLVATADSELELATDANVTIVTGVWMVFAFAALTSPTSITINIGGDISVYTYPVGDANAVRAEAVIHISARTGVAEVVPLGTQADGRAIVAVRTGFVYAASVTGGGASVYRATPATVTASITGPRSAEAGTVTRVRSSVAGWVGVVNTTAAVIGANIETDAAYKARHKELLGSTGNATPRGLVGRLRACDDTIVAVSMTMNTSHLFDADGRPPHCFEAVVLGGSDLKIAEQIWLSHTTGTQSYGSVAVDVLDDRGEVEMARTVYFTRPTTRYVHVYAVITRGEGFPPVALTDLQTDIGEYLETWGNGLGIGRDVYLAEVTSKITSRISGGILAITVYLATTTTPSGSPSLSAANIYITSRELSSWDASRIEVEIV